jgi:hypothetical protein
MNTKRHPYGPAIEKDSEYCLDVDTWLALLRFVAWGTRNMDENTAGRQWSALITLFRKSLQPTPLKAFEAALAVVSLCGYPGIPFEPEGVPYDLEI